MSAGLAAALLATFSLLLALGLLALAVPASAVLAGRLEPAQLITFVLAAWGVLAISSMGREAYDIEYGLRGVVAADELTAKYGTPRTPQPPGPAVEEPPVIHFENVVFRYPGGDRPVLNGLTVTLRPGETVAVVGENGAGKTTFVKLLAGLYRPDSGRITVDGADLATLDPASWRRRLAVLFQDYVRYPASLRDNITFAAAERSSAGRSTAGRSTADRGAARSAVAERAVDAAVRDALDRAGGAALLAELSGDLDTSLWREGADGRDLSGGQWQRVTLARMLFAASAGRQVLVLDEPTAHLDIRAEAEFHERVVSRVHGTTTVLISHRLSTVRPAGRIILLRDGRVAEDGSHDELLALGADYARFFTVQAEAFRAGAA